MAVEFCAECGRELAKFFVIHPASGRPVRVCSNCERRLAETIVAKRTKTSHRKGTWRPRF